MCCHFYTQALLVLRDRFCMHSLSVLTSLFWHGTLTLCRCRQPTTQKSVTGQILYAQPQRFDFFILAWNFNTLPLPAANNSFLLSFNSLLFAFLKLAFIYMLLLRYDWSTKHTFPSRIKDNEITAWA